MSGTGDKVPFGDPSVVVQPLKPFPALSSRTPTAVSTSLRQTPEADKTSVSEREQDRNMHTWRRYPLGICSNARKAHGRDSILRWHQEMGCRDLVGSAAAVVRGCWDGSSRGVLSLRFSSTMDGVLQHVTAGAHIRSANLTTVSPRVGKIRVLQGSELFGRVGLFGFVSHQICASSRQ